MHNIAELKFDDLQVGETRQFEVEISKELVDRFAEISGDFNPLHLDNEYAQGTQFGDRVAHGFLGALYFSRLIGMHLPGKFALYLSQQVFFRSPIIIGNTISVRGTILQKVEAMKTVKVKTEIYDQVSQKLLIDGEAMVKVLE